jgi:hypothetical protein
MSYGPGRYDPEYEERGHDYPLPYVRWTEKRNIESFLELVNDGRVDVERLTTHRFGIDEAERAYDLISAESTASYLGVVLNYDPESEVIRKVSLGAASPVRKSEKSIGLGVIGAGGYVPAMLLPHFKNERVEFRSIATATGVTAHDVGKRFGFAHAMSSAQEVLDDASVNLVVIGTRNNHDPEPFLAPLARLVHRVVATAPPFRPKPAAETAAAAERAGLAVQIVEPAAAAIAGTWEAAQPGVGGVVTGSFYVVGETPRALRGAWSGADDEG